MEAGWAVQEGKLRHQLLLRTLVTSLFDVFPLGPFYYHIPTFADGTIPDLVISKTSAGAGIGVHIIFETKTCELMD